MRKALSAGVLAIMMLTSAALADVYEGTTAAAASVQVEAAAAGTLSEWNAAVGELVGEGDAVGAVRTTKVFATQEGTVAEISAQEGDDAEGTVLELYPMEQYEVYCTVDDAYQSAASTLVHSGERIYMKCTVNGTHRGTGMITEIDGGEFHVLATGGEFYVGETVYLYRDADFSYKQRIGIGTVVTSATEAYEADGSIVRLHVEEGEYVERGELLFEYVDGEEAVFTAEKAGIVTEVSVRPGDSVKKDQALMTLVPQDQICVEITVDETAAAQIEAGDAAELVFAAAAAETPVSGLVTDVFHIAENGMYTVRIMPLNAPELKLGLSVSVRIGE